MKKKAKVREFFQSGKVATMVSLNLILLSITQYYLVQLYIT